MEAKSSELIGTESPTAHPLRLLLDGRKLRDGGIGVYIDNLILGLLEIGGVSITVIYGDDRCRDASYADKVEWLWDPATPYSFDEMMKMSSRIDFSRYDIFHTPHYMLPYRIPIPTVVTVHDLIHISHPEKMWYPAVARFLIRSAVRRADGVLAVSRHTQAGVKRLTRAADEKIRYVPNAISPRLLSPASESILPNVESPYLFALFSNTKPHKGLADLVAAYEEFREGQQWRAYAAECPMLILAGFGIERYVSSAEGRAVLAGVEGVRAIGAVSDSELALYVKEALALVVPSHIEGFCLPAVEAQAVGTPVICRPVPALLELVTEKDTVADSFSITSLAKAIEAGLARGGASDRTPAAAHVQLYSCVNIASMVRSEYERILALRRGS
ncbi:MAG: D-inositol 3-phosphate glycosyltransferase [Pseudomonadota bacterium]